ncbi:Fc.00g069940.m01.CDS01 [Cosmosporella sp. VM-42]
MAALTRLLVAALALGGNVNASINTCHPSTKTVTTTKTVTAEAKSTTTSAKSTSSPKVAPKALTDFKAGVQWEICIHKPIKHDSVDDFIPKEAVVWDIDLSHAQDYPGMIPMLKKAGKIVICYFNAGAVQNWDADKSQFPTEVIGKSLAYPYVGEDGEWYLDIRDSRVLDLMKARLDAAIAVGCDGVDPDNVDAWKQDDNDPTGFSLKSSDYTKYLTNLAAYAHSKKTQQGQPLLVGQKNAPEIANSLVAVLDFAVLESCRGSSDASEAAYPFCSEFQPYNAENKPVFQIEYPPSVSKTGAMSSSDNTFYCKAEEDDKGFSKIIKWASEQLDGWGQYCGGTSFKTPTISE